MKEYALIKNNENNLYHFLLLKLTNMVGLMQLENLYVLPMI